MNHLVRQISLFALLVALLAVPQMLRAQALVTLKNGQERKVKVVNVTNASLSWSYFPAGGGILSTPYSQIANIEFPANRDWEAAENQLSMGNYHEAGRLYSEISSQ